jgi:hypothetical protein
MLPVKYRRSERQRSFRDVADGSPLHCHVVAILGAHERAVPQLWRNRETMADHMGNGTEELRILSP